MAIIYKIIIGTIIPTSLEIVLFMESSVSANKTAQTISVDKIAMKLKRETFKNRTLIGTKKKIIMTTAGTKSG